jgi:hypothetical protein
MAFTNLKTNQAEFLETHLRGTGRTMSSAQAEATYGIQNLRARMSELRSLGLRVRKTTNTVGRTTYAISRRDAFGSQAKLLA